MTLLKILTALYKSFEEAFARYGCGVAGIPYPDDIKDSKTTLP